MKEVCKVILKTFLSLVLVFSIFSFINVVADEEVFKITDLKVKEKSANVIVDNVKIVNGNINNNVSFKSVGDNITYEITIKNVDDKKYKVKSFTDDNTSEYIKYEYDAKEGTEVNSGDSISYAIKMSYVKEVDGDSISNVPVNFTLVYEDNSGVVNSFTTAVSNNIKNPATNDSIIIYVVLFFISLIGLILLKRGKKKAIARLMTIVIGTTILMPLATNALSTKITITFNNYIDNISKMTYLKEGSVVNDIIGALAGDPSNVLYIKCASNEQYKIVQNNLSEDNIISEADSNYNVYMWYDSGTIYYYSEANKIYLNRVSYELFFGLVNVSSIDFSKLNTSIVENMDAMFSGCSSIKELDLSSFNTSNVIDMGGMFLGCNSLEKVNLKSFDTKNVLTMTMMFTDCYSLSEVDLSNFVTSSLVTIDSMFCACHAIKSISLTSFDTTHVEDMTMMFAECYNLETIDLSSFDTSNVIYTGSVFALDGKLKTIYASEKFTFDSSIIDENESFFGDCISLVGGAGTVYNDEFATIKYARIDDPDNGAPGYFTLKS